MPATPEQPNVIFFFSDQQRWDTCGCYGQELDITPNLDRLASEGVRFENAFTCQPVCGPARACIQTGKYATETGCFTNGCMLPLDEKGIAHHFSEAGYEVGYLGKWHLASNTKVDPEDTYRDSPVPPERRGGYKDFWLASDLLESTSHSYDGYMFDADGNRVDFPEGRYRVDCVTDYMLDFLKNRSQEKPLFLFVSYIEPHHQNDHKCYEGPNGSKERFKDYKVPGDLVDTGGDWRENYPDYLGCCNSLDENVGRLCDTLKELGMDENTVLFYTSDHGSHFRTRNNEYKRSCHEGCIRIPMIAHGPGFRGGKVVREIASLIDVAPTLLATAGVTPPSSMRGRPLQEIVDDPPADWPEEAFLQISESQVGRAIRTKRWKYSVCAPDKHRWADPGSDRYAEDFFYDLEADPYERNNLVRDPQYAGVRAELCERLKDRMEAAGESRPEILPAAPDSGAA